jgi:hypothetical protein
VLPISNGCDVSVSTGGSGTDGFIDGFIASVFIASVLETGDELSPLEMFI